MNQELSQSGKTTGPEMKNRKLLFFVYAAIIMITVLATASPVFRAAQFNKMVNSDSTYLQGYDRALNDTSVADKARDKAFKEALLSLSEDDSINLILNINDSVLSLAIHGVIIHQTKISDIRTDFLLRKMPQALYLRFFSRPLKIQSDFATIIKEPVVEKEAPKDTLEAMLNASYTPDTLIHDPAFAVLKTDYGMQIIMKQESNPKFKDKAINFVFNVRRTADGLWRTAKSIATLKFNHYTPDIKIKLPAGDLRAIYRALPSKPQIVIYFYH